jgi:cystathionine beta-lyase/cystathionine gamma-synthase
MTAGAFPIRYDFIDFTDVANIKRHLRPTTKLIFSESPANPTLTLTDIAAVSELAHAAGIPHAVERRALAFYCLPMAFC